MISSHASLISGQEAERDVQRLCESYAWLTEVHAFLSQWSPASLESLKGRPSALYRQLLEKVAHWAERILAVPSSISTGNQLFIIQCTGLKERLGMFYSEGLTGKYCFLSSSKSFSLKCC